MKTKRLYSVSLIALAMFLAAQPAAAQYRDSLGVPFNSPFSATMSTMIWNEINKSILTPSQRQNRGTSDRSGSRTSGQAQAEKIPAYRQYKTVQFKSTGTRLLVQEMADSFSGTLQDTAETKALLTDILNKYEAAAAKKGYPNDLALAIVSYIGLNSYVYNQKTEEMILPFEQNIGLRDVVAEHATDNRIFENWTDRQKQEMYEALVMFAGATYHFYEDARKKNNAEDLKTCKLVAAQNLKRLGIGL
jgi:hypothetical protein